jgi:hypothetical protein
VLKREDQFAFLLTSGSVLRRMRNVSDISCRENQNTHLMLNKFFFLKIVPFLDNAEKYSRAEQSTDDNMTHAHCMLDT